jgi:hypothetical protein
MEVFTGDITYRWGESVTENRISKGCSNLTNKVNLLFRKFIFDLVG